MFLFYLNGKTFSNVKINGKILFYEFKIKLEKITDIDKNVLKLALILCLFQQYTYIL